MLPLVCRICCDNIILSLNNYEKLSDATQDLQKCLQLLTTASATPFAISVHSEVLTATRKLLAAVNECECIIRELSESCNTGSYHSTIPSVLLFLCLSSIGYRDHPLFPS